MPPNRGERFHLRAWSRGEEEGDDGDRFIVGDGDEEEVRRGEWSVGGSQLQWREGDSTGPRRRRRRTRGGGGGGGCPSASGSRHIRSGTGNNGALLPLP